MPKSEALPPAPPPAPVHVLYRRSHKFGDAFIESRTENTLTTRRRSRLSNAGMPKHGPHPRPKLSTPPQHHHPPPSDPVIRCENHGNRRLEATPSTPVQNRVGSTCQTLTTNKQTSSIRIIQSHQTVRALQPLIYLPLPATPHSNKGSSLP
jgi:hypothetical protein